MIKAPDDIFVSLYLDDPYMYLPYKKGEAKQIWYCFRSKKECQEFLDSKRSQYCWKGFKPRRYNLTLAKKKKHG